MKGAETYGFDISEVGVEVARKKSAANNLSAKFETMDAEHLIFDDSFFDYIVGFEALHHTIIHPRTPSELHRVIKSGGSIAFGENDGENPAIEAVRGMVTMRRNKSGERGEVTL